MFPAETVHAEASIVADTVQASATILTGKRSAIVGVNDTIPTFVPFCAKALIGAIGVSASSTVSTRRRHHTLIDVLVAESASVTDRASAREVEKVGGW